jgi:hypothetical protein
MQVPVESLSAVLNDEDADVQAVARQRWREERPDRISVLRGGENDDEPAS